MKCNRNMKLYSLYGLAAFNFLVLLYTHVGHPVDITGPVKFSNKNLILLHKEVQLQDEELITDEKKVAINNRPIEDAPFNRYNSIENISNDSPIFPQYKLLLNPSNKCLDEENDFSDIFLLVLITSSVRNFKQRQAVRETWASRTSIMGKKILPLFLLGVNFGGRQNYIKQVNEEYAKHGDLIMEDFSDTYLNLTLKTIMGFKWMNFYCPTAKYVMKTDDDMFINLNYTVQHLAKKPSTLKRFVMGHVIVGSPIRNEKSKWYMSYELYPYNDYPPFASGTCYVMSSDVTKDTYQISRHMRYLHLEDVFSALCWERLGIVPHNHKGFNLSRVKYSYCRYLKLVSVHNVKVYKMFELWRKFSQDMLEVPRYYCLFNGWFF